LTTSFTKERSARTSSEKTGGRSIPSSWGRDSGLRLKSAPEGRSVSWELYLLGKEREKKRKEKKRNKGRVDIRVPGVAVAFFERLGL